MSKPFFDPFEVLVDDDGINFGKHNASMFLEKSQFQNIIDTLVDLAILHSLCYLDCGSLTQPIVGGPGIGQSYLIATLYSSVVEMMNKEEGVDSFSIDLAVGVEPDYFRKSGLDVMALIYLVCPRFVMSAEDEEVPNNNADKYGHGENGAHRKQPFTKREGVPLITSTELR